MTLRLSVLDQTPIPDGTTGAGALANTLDLAQHAERLGYHRYWSPSTTAVCRSPARRRKY